MAFLLTGGDVALNTTVATEEEFGRLLEKIEENLRRDVGRMRSGCIPATPGADACRRCKMASICRKEPGRAREAAEDGDA